MNAPQCWETADRDRALRSREARDALITLGINALSQQFMDAMKAPDLTKVLLPTPDFADGLGGTHELSALDLIRDLLADTAGDVLLQQMVQHIAAAARGEPVQMQCKTFLSRLSGIYAGRHAAAYMLGEDE